MSIPSCGLGDDVVQRALYSPKEVQQMLGISHATVYRLLAARRLDGRKLDGKTVSRPADFGATAGASAASTGKGSCRRVGGLTMSAGPESRRYQLDEIARVNAETDAGGRGVLKVMNTGAGKTVKWTASLADNLQRGCRALWLAHRREFDRPSLPKGARARLSQGMGRPQVPQTVWRLATAAFLGTAGQMRQPALGHDPANRLRQIIREVS